MFKNRKTHLSFVVAGKISPNDSIEDFENPKFGRYWWFWKPCTTWNGGDFNKKECIDFSICWLCFSLGFTSFWVGEK